MTDSDAAAVCRSCGDHIAAPPSRRQVLAGAGAGLAGVLVPGVSRAGPIPPNACEAGLPLSLDLQIDYGTVTIRDDWHGRTQLAGLRRQGDRVLLGYQHTAGQTVAQLKWRTTGDFQAIRIGRQHCVVLRAVQMSIGFPQISVTIDQRFPRQSCEYQAILDHEMQHVAICRQQLRRFDPYLREWLRYAGDKVLPVPISTWTADRRIMTAVLDTLRQHMDPVMDRLAQDINRANLAIDTPDNYRRTWARCGVRQ